MEKGKGCATFLLIIFLILLALIGIFLFAPELLSGYLPRPGENAVADSVVSFLKPFTNALDDIAASVGEFFASFQLR